MHEVSLRTFLLRSVKIRFIRGIRVPLPPPCQATFANTSDTFTRHAEHAGTMLPPSAASPPMTGPHHSASSAIMNFGKNAIGQGTPPKNLLTTYHVAAE